MKVLLLNGSPHENGTTKRALTEVAKSLNENGVETEILTVGNKRVAGCMACGGCAKTGKCVFDDELIFEIAPEWGKMLFKSDDIKLCLDSLEVINGISFYFQASNFLHLSLPKGVDVLLTHYPPEIYEYVGEERPERHFYGHIHESEGEVYASDSTIYNNVCCYNHCKEALREKIDNSIRRVRAIRNKRRDEDVQRTEE
jgi:hypothetical protein